MRKFTLFVLLATSAVPAVAAPGDGQRGSRNASEARSENQSQRAEQRAERREARQQRQADRQQSARSDNPAAAAVLRQRFQQQSQQPQRQAWQQQRVRQQSLQRQQGGSALVSRYRQLQQQQGQGQFRDDAAREQYRQQYRQRLEAQGGTYVPRQGGYRTIPGTRPQIGVSGPVRSDVRSGQRYDRRDRNRWTSQWRNDNRYDWRRYRDRNRTIFRIGFYSDPFGYDYRRFSIGSFLYPNYYQSNYWISDPWQYRLPPAYGPYRWVRYHNDAVLIDTYTGEVEDVIYGFFW